MNTAVYGSFTGTSPSVGACSLGTTGSHGPDRITKITYDNANRTTQVDRAYASGTSAAATEQFVYTNNSQVSYVIDGQANRTTYEYDGHDRLIKTRFPVSTQGSNSSSTTDYEELTWGNNSTTNPTLVVQKRLRDANTISLSYDNLKRVTSFGGSTVSTRDFTYNLLGMPTAVTYNGGSQNGQAVSYAYDAFGRVTSETQPMGAVAYQYDAASRLTRITWPDSLYVQYDYDTAGKVTAVRENGAGSGIGVLATYTYDSLGRRASVAYGNGTSRNYEWDALSRLSGLKIDLSGTGDDLIIGAVGGSGTAISYNPASQIASLTRSNDAYAWTAHANVNRNYTTNGLNQYTAAGSTSLGYDARGNLTSSGSSQSFSYNGLNELTSVTVNSATTNLNFDPIGRLYNYSVLGGTQRSLYAGSSLVGEYGSSTMLRRFVHGPGTDEPIVWYEGSDTSTRRWLQADERGSVVAVSDASGAKYAINSYDEYGIPANGNAGRFQYTGQAWLGDIGLYNYKARMYSPTLGRFMQTDPIGYGDGLNWYNYVGGDPVNARDPSGMAWDIIDGLGNVYRLNCAGVEGTPRKCGWSSIGYDHNAAGLARWLGHLFEYSTHASSGEVGGPGSPAKNAAEEPQNGHNYSVERNLRCSAAGGFEALKDSGAAPFVDPIPDGMTTRNVTTMGQPITQLIDPGTRSVTNVTGDGHILRYGSVRLSVTPTGPHSSRLTIRGVGTNTNWLTATFNQYGGRLIFEEMASKVQRHCSIRD